MELTDFAIATLFHIGSFTILSAWALFVGPRIAGTIGGLNVIAGGYWVVMGGGSVLLDALFRYGGLVQVLLGLLVIGFAIESSDRRLPAPR